MRQQRQALPDFDHDYDLPIALHQAAALDELAVTRIQHLWEGWMRSNTPEQRNKHRFHQSVILRQPEFSDLRLTTIYVLLARYDAAFKPRLSPA